MTVSNQTNRTSATGTDTAGQEISYSFPANLSSDLVVKTRVTATGVPATLALTTDYTATVSDTGGTVTMVAAIPATKEIHIIRNTPNTQSLDLVSGGSFDAESLEDALDKVTKLAIENKDALTRTLRFPATDPATAVPDQANSIDRRGKYQFYDSSTGAPTVASAVDLSAITVSPFAETYLDDADALATMATLNGMYVVNVVHYGADPTGVADSAPAIRLAIADIQALQYAGGLTTTSRQTLFFPMGVYKIDSALTPDTSNITQYVKFFGDKAQLVFAAGITGFGGIGTESHFSGLTFHGGAVAISIKTANLNTTKITIENCIFVSQTVNCIQADNGSNSTLLNIDNCKFVENTTASMHLLDTGSMDIVNMSRCWSSGSPAIPIEASGARLNLTECQFFPRGITAWINQTGAAVRLDRCTLSGEDGGGCFVDFRATAGVLQVENCTLFSNDAAIRFYAMPKSFKWDNNQGSFGAQNEGGAQTGGFWFDDSISQSDVNDIWDNDSRYITAGFMPNRLTGGAELADIFMAIQVPINQPPSQPLDTDLVLVLDSSDGGFGSNQSSNDITQVSAVAEPIFGIPCNTILATADDGAYQRRWTTALNGFAVGNYTSVRMIRVETESTISLQIRAGERSTTVRHFGNGYHVVCMPFHFETNEMVGTSVLAMRDTDKIWLGPTRIYSNYHVINTINDVRWGDTIPTTLRHYIGDRVINSVPGAGESTGWVCVAAGTPGTWVPYGMIQSANAYTTSNLSTDRVLDASGDTLNQVADVLGTLIEDLKTSGLLKSP